MPSRQTHNYSSSSGSSRSSSSTYDAATSQKKGMPLVILNDPDHANANIFAAPSYDQKSSSRLDSRLSEPKRTSQRTSSSYDTTITPDTSRSRTKSNYGEPVIRDERKALKDERRSKTSDSRYYPNSFLDSGATYSKSSTRNDSRFYENSSYYLGRR